VGICDTNFNKQKNMNKQIFTFFSLAILWTLMGCSTKLIKLQDSELRVVNREISSIDKATNSIALNDKQGDGLAIIEEIDFEVGTLEIDLKGEDIRGKSFVGIAFNIQNDSTYEAIYFRPFNFQAKEKIRREHSVQYISHPKHNWRFLRTNNEGQFEAEFGRQPAPADWFKVEIKVEKESVIVYDKVTDKELLAVKRLAKPTSKKIGLWMGNNSKGGFRNLRIKQ